MNDSLQLGSLIDDDRTCFYVLCLGIGGGVLELVLVFASYTAVV